MNYIGTLGAAGAKSRAKLVRLAHFRRTCVHHSSPFLYEYVNATGRWNSRCSLRRKGKTIDAAGKNGAAATALSAEFPFVIAGCFRYLHLADRVSRSFFFFFNRQALANSLRVKIYIWNIAEWEHRRESVTNYLCANIVTRTNNFIEKRAQLNRTSSNLLYTSFADCRIYYIYSIQITSSSRCVCLALLVITK